ncbi:MAG TPA: NosD domain-containing protein [Methanotrichaceae archaeon]|nr:NosD domain-containing protein [Methanotrichaceae archaeon]
MCSADAAVITVLPGDSSPGIQQAIEKADSGDVVEVFGGIYKENVNVTKPLILRGMASGSEMPVIDAGGNECAIVISADGVRIDGIRATNSSEDGIQVISNGNSILNSTADNNEYAGIALDDSSNNTLSGNTVYSNGDAGIELDQSDGNAIRSNVARDNGDAGIEVSKSGQNVIVDNLAFNNSNDGIELLSSINNTIKLNRADRNKDGICLEVDSRKNIVSHNSASQSQVTGIQIRSSNENFISDNNISGCHDAVFLESSYENIITNNIAMNNRIGISINYYSADNRVYGNILDHNLDYNAYDESGQNQWDDGRSGNFYGDYSSPAQVCQDKDGDGACDAAHSIQGGASTDRHPLCRAPSRTPI